MQKFFYPIFKLPEEYTKDFEKRELPRWIKYYLYKKSTRELSNILQDSNFILQNTIKKNFKKFIVGGNSEQAHYEGTNHFDGELELGIYSGSTGAKIANDNYVRSKNYIKVDELSNYKFSLNGEGISLDIYEYKEDYSYNLTGTKVVNSQSSLTTESGTKYITFRTINETTDTDLKIQLNSGTTILPYEPYVGGIPSPNEQYEQPIQNVIGTIVNKVNNRNLYDKDNPNILYTAIDANGLGNNVPSTYRTVFIKCFPNTDYVISKKFDSTKNRFAIGYTKETPNYNKPVYGTLFVNNKGTETIHTGADAKYLVAYVWISGGSTTAEEMLDSIKIEPGTTATPYVNHEEQILPFTLAEGERMYKESCLKDDGKHHKRTQINLKNLEWTYRNTNITTGLSIFSSNIANRKKSNLLNVLCTHYLYNGTVAGNGSISGEAGLYFYYNIQNPTSGTIYLVCSFSDITALNTFLNENDVIMEYELAEEQIVPYNSTQQTQYNAIKNAYTYNDLTIVETSSDDATPILTLQYFRKKGSVDNVLRVLPSLDNDNSETTYDLTFLNETKGEQNDENN